MSKLTDEQALAVCRYVREGGTPIGASRELGKTYDELMTELRSTPAHSEAYLQATKDRSEWAREAVLSELKNLSTLKATEIFNDDGTIKPTSEWSDQMARGLQSLEVQELWGPAPDGKGPKVQVGVVKKLKFHPKLQALDLLGKHLEMFNVKVDVSAEMNWGDMVTEAYQATARVLPAAEGEDPE